VKQGVVLTARNRTGPPCSVGLPTAHAPGLPAALQTTTTPTDASEQNNASPLGGPVIMGDASPGVDPTTILFITVTPITIYQSV